MKPFEKSTFSRTTMQIQSQGPSTGLQASLPHLRVRFDSFSEEEKNISMSRDPSRACLHTWNLLKKIYTTQFSGERILHTVNA